MKKLNYDEKELLKSVLLNAIGNGNTVNPKAFVPTPKQYKLLHSIVQKCDLDKKD